MLTPAAQFHDEGKSKVECKREICIIVQGPATHALSCT